MIKHSGEWYFILKDNLTILKGYFLTSPLFRVSFILTTMGVLSGALGYAYQILIGRMLNPTELGLFSAVISLTTIFSSPLGAITLIVSKKISSLSAKGNIRGLQEAGKKILLYITGGALFFLVIVYCFIDGVREQLNNPGNYLIWLFACMVVLSALISLNTAFFQGLQKYKWYATTGFIWSLLKMLSALFLIGVLGRGIDGAVESAMLSQLAIWLLGFYLIIKTLFRGESETLAILGDDSNGANISPKTIFAIVAATTSFVIITQLDVVLANKFFSPVMASQYAAAAILGKAILYIAGGLVFALFPMVVSNDVNRISSAHLMKQAILLTIVFCLPICIVYFFFGGHLITFFYGDKYPEAGNLLSYFGFAMLPMALILVMEHFLLAKSRILFTLIVMLLVPIQIFIIYRWHDSLFNLIGSVFFIGSLAFLVGVVILFREFKLSISNK